MNLAEQIRYFFGRHSRMKKIFKPLYVVFYKKRVTKKQNQIFRENGLSVLEAFDECMNEAGVNYMLAFGTLLGAVREKGFIKHDLDIDVYVWIDEYSSNMVDVLQKKGFKLTRQILVDDGKRGKEETYQLASTDIDIFYIFPPVDKLPYTCSFTAYPPYPTFESSMEKMGKILAHRFEIPFTHQRSYLPFETIKLPVPSNADEVLRFVYGDDYMTPNPNWSALQYDEHIVVWYDATAVYRTF